MYLVATDGSAVSDTAVEHAAVEASVRDASFEIVHVLIPETEFVGGEIVLAGDEAATEQGEQTLEQASRVAREAAGEHGDGGIEIRTELLTGRPAEAITEYADRRGAAGVYVGHRGLSDRRERVVGSVAKSVVDKATVPVTVVK